MDGVHIINNFKKSFIKILFFFNLFYLHYKMSTPWLDLNTQDIHLANDFYINNNPGSAGQIIAKTALGLDYVNVSFSGSTGIKVFDLALCDTTLAWNLGGSSCCYGGIVVPTNNTNVTGMNFYVTQTGATGNVQAAIYQVNDANINLANLVTYSAIESRTLIGGKNTISLTPATLIGGEEYYLVIQFLNNAATIAAKSNLGYPNSTSSPNLNFKLNNVNTSFASIPNLNVSDYTSDICPWLQAF